MDKWAGGCEGGLDGGGGGGLGLGLGTRLMGECEGARPPSGGESAPPPDSNKSPPSLIFRAAMSKSCDTFFAEKAYSPPPGHLWPASNELNHISTFAST